MCSHTTLASTPPVRFSNNTGGSLELRIVGYQFPDNLHDEYDADWLRVEGVATHPNGNWRFLDSCLLTWEALALADWLDSWDRAKNQQPRIGFIEPNLSFSRIDSSPASILRISFELESRPNWARKSFVESPDVWLDFPYNAAGAEIAAKQMRSQLEAFPVRVEPERSRTD